ncbi:hypothetical protein MKW94_023866, partial [Papaver nudicaule]|nr:hypothetical protein [Papaver nudicaule]
MAGEGVLAAMKDVSIINYQHRFAGVKRQSDFHKKAFGIGKSNQSDFHKKAFGIGKSNLSTTTKTTTTTTKMVSMKLERQRRTQNVEGDFFVGYYDCGYHSEASYGATSYFITHPDGNILVDSPRYTERLARRIETLGGVRYMFLTHKDDVADHDKWSKRLGCDRVLHSQD